MTDREEAEQLVLLGKRQLDGRELAAAEETLGRALVLFPNHAQALHLLGVVNLLNGQLEEATRLIEKSIALDSGNEWAHCNLGTAKALLGNKEKAIGHYRAALAITSENADIQRNLADIFLGMERPVEAINHYEKALTLDPKNIGAWTNIGLALCRLGKIEEAVFAYKTALKIMPNIETRSSLLLAMNYSDKYSAEDLFNEAREWARVYAPESLILLPAATDLNPERKLRIGYVSGDFRKHPVAYSLKNTLVNHDKENFEIFCYANQVVGDEYTELLQKYADHWTPIFGLSDAAAAEKIRADKIDILIDLSGHTALNRLLLLARKPAPIQATWIGYVGTTGMRQMDYFICSAAELYPGLEKFFSEKFMIIPGHNASSAISAGEVEVGGLPALKNGYVTFGCFNSIAKITPEVIELWSKVLLAVPGSVLYLKSGAFADESMRQEYQKLFAAHAIPQERLRLESVSPKDEYYDCYNLVDIALDPFPYNGGTTTIDTLWMGVPVITLAGKTLMARSGVCILTNSGHAEWVADSKEEYVDKAVKLAWDLPKLGQIRAGMREKLKTTAIYNPSIFTRNFENKLRETWREYCKKTSSQNG